MENKSRCLMGMPPDKKCSQSTCLKCPNSGLTLSQIAADEDVLEFECETIGSYQRRHLQEQFWSETSLAATDWVVTKRKSDEGKAVNAQKSIEAEKTRQVLLDAVDNWRAKKQEKEGLFKLTPEGKEIPLASKLFCLCQDLANGIGELANSDSKQIEHIKYVEKLWNQHRPISWEEANALIKKLQKENAELKETIAMLEAHNAEWEQKYGRLVDKYNHRYLELTKKFWVLGGRCKVDSSKPENVAFNQGIEEAVSTLKTIIHTLEGELL